MQLNFNRLERIYDNLSLCGTNQMLITDANAIFYLTGCMLYCGSRFMALFIRRGRQPVLFLNRLYSEPDIKGVELAGFSDTDDITILVSSYIAKNQPLGIDRRMPAGYLIDLQRLGAAESYLNTSYGVEQVRSQKDEKEQQLMKAASAINDLAMERFKKLIGPGITEKEVAAHIEPIYRSLGADGVSFQPIVSFGANASDPHHKPDYTVLKEGDCVLFDVGCRKDYYCSDMTRTFFYKKVSPEAKKIYEIVKQANLAAEEIIRPGKSFCEVDYAARNLIEKAGYGENFTHRLGHSIGIEVHEPGDVNPANHTMLKAGNIFSCEPGIYLKGRLGVRIEDLILVTENGMERLNNYPKDLEIIG